MDIKTTLHTERKEHGEEVESFKKTFEKRCELYQQEVTNLKAKVSELSDEKHNLLDESNAAKFDFNYFESRMVKFQEIIYKLESENEKLQKDLLTSKTAQPSSSNKDSKTEYLHKSNGSVDLRNNERPHKVMFI